MSEWSAYVVRLCTPLSVLCIFAAVVRKKLIWFLLSRGCVNGCVMTGALNVNAVDARRVVLVMEARMNCGGSEVGFIRAVGC